MGTRTNSMIIKEEEEGRVALVLQPISQSHRKSYKLNVLAGMDIISLNVVPIYLKDMVCNLTLQKLMKKFVC